MSIKFYKFHGAGNDFIIIDNRISPVDLSTTQLAFMCDRRFGIGADGLMLLNASKEYDFHMKYYNADGLEGSMCGNGGRCIVAFANYLKLAEKSFTFEAVDGVHKALINSYAEGIWNISLEMKDVQEIDQSEDSFFIDTGSPHHIEIVDSIENIQVFDRGRSIRNSEGYKAIGGTNVNFIKIEKDLISIRTYERGVEDETLACGTGVTAAALAASVLRGEKSGDYSVKALGGDLSVTFKNENGLFSNIWLTGPAAMVYNGEFKIL